MSEDTEEASRETPIKVDQLSTLIRSDIEGIKKAGANWKKRVFSLCQHVYEARQRFKADAEFGAWWDAQEFNLGKDERAALIQMGSDVGATRRCLAETERRSIRLIALHELQRFRSVAIPEASAKPKKAKEADLVSVFAAINPLADALDLAMRERGLAFVDDTFKEWRVKQMAEKQAA
jgi:hypothetical protein